MKPPFRLEADNYTLYGALFGLVFPVIGLLIATVVETGSFTLPVALTVFRSQPLLWIITSAPLFLGLFARLAGVRQDRLKLVIFDLEQNQERLTESVRVAENASQAKSQLVANVSHELRTPLGSIVGYSEMLQAGVFGVLAPEQDSALAKVMDNTRYLTGLVNNLLDQSRLDADKLTLKNRPYSVDDLLQGVQTKMDVLARAKGLALTVACDNKLPTTLTGDVERMQQIMINLVDNAIKFTEKGKVDLRVFRENESFWSICVADTGLGIPTEYQASIFEPFFVIPRGGPQASEGTGLGLAIVKQLCQLMGGKIGVESTAGEGSIFTVLLPLEVPKEKVE